MSLVRAKDTKPELTVGRLVYSLGYRYRLHDRSLPGHSEGVHETTEADIRSWVLLAQTR